MANFALTCGFAVTVTLAVEEQFRPKPRPMEVVVHAMEAKVRAELPDLVLTSAKLWVPVVHFEVHCLGVGSAVLVLVRFLFAVSEFSQLIFSANACSCACINPGVCRMECLYLPSPAPPAASASRT